VDPREAVIGVRVEPLEERVLSGVEVRADPPPGQPDVTVEPQSIQLRLAGAL
jgi:hypothetical protein